MPRNKFCISLTALLLTAVLAGCATVPGGRPVAGGDEIYLKDVCAQNGVDWEWDQVAQVITLNYRGVNAQALIGSDLVLVGEEKITLGAPVQRFKSAVIVGEDFQSAVIDPLRQKAARRESYTFARVRKIMVDAGHGGKDPGAIGRTGVQEKGVVLDIAKRLARILEKQGYEIEMTRADDRFISLEDRTAMASRGKADLFVSIHANASPARNVTGMEIYSAKDLSFVDRIEAQRKINETLLFKSLMIDRENAGAKKIVADMLYDHKQAESRAMAEYIAHRAARMSKAKNRGAKSARFFVLRNTLVPAILVEVGFLTNPKEEKLLKTGTYRQRMARSLAESLEDYINGR